MQKHVLLLFITTDNKREDTDARPGTPLII